MCGLSYFVPAEPLQLISCFNVSTPGRRQSKMLLTMDERGSKIDRNSVFDCHLSPVGRQMAIKNSVSNNLLSAFVGSINIFHCRLPGVVSLANCYHFHCLTLCKGHLQFFNFLHAGYYLITNKWASTWENLSSGFAINKGADQRCQCLYYLLILRGLRSTKAQIRAVSAFSYSLGFAINKGADQGCQRLCLFFRVCDQQRRSSALSAPLIFVYWIVSYLNLLQAKFQFSSKPLQLRQVWGNACIYE